MDPRRIKLVVEKKTTEKTLPTRYLSFFSSSASTMALPHLDPSVPYYAQIHRLWGISAGFLLFHKFRGYFLSNFPQISICSLPHPPFQLCASVQIEDFILHPEDLSALPDLATFSSRSPCTQPSDPWLYILLLRSKGHALTGRAPGLLLLPPSSVCLPILLLLLLTWPRSSSYLHTTSPFAPLHLCSPCFNSSPDHLLFTS